MTILKNRRLWRPGFRSGLALGLISICSGLPGAWAQDATPSEVTVPDASLRTVLEDSLGLAAGDPIVATELAGLTVLEARDAGILDLTGLENATGLTRLHLGPEAGGFPWDNSNDISDLSPLSGLTSLRWLNLAGNPVSDLTPLSRLTGLSYLNLQGCPIFDESLSALASLTGLTDLYLGLTGVMDAASLSGLSGLTVHGIPRPKRYPKMERGLSNIVEDYEAALEAGRVTSRVGGGPCYLDEFPADFRNWDPSEPAPSIAVRIGVRLGYVDRVTGYLGDHGIRCGSLEERLPCYATNVLIVSCVPVPLLAALSELPGVEKIDWEAASLPDSPTLLGGVSWGTIKDRFK